MKRCAWCTRPIEGKRADSRFCLTVCRQAAFRARRGYGLERRGEFVTEPLSLAYADPPYPGTARRYYGKEKDFAGEVDHRALVRKLARFDGWALSTSAKALREVRAQQAKRGGLMRWVRNGEALIVNGREQSHVYSRRGRKAPRSRRSERRGGQS